MSDRKISEIKHFSFMSKEKVAVYCRVSTKQDAQLDSLANQATYYTRMVENRVNWELVDIYIDVQSGKSASNRPGLQRLLEDCRNHKVDLIITKSISRLGRNTVESLELLRMLHNLNVDVFFETENIHSKDTGKEFLLSLFQMAAQAESEARSQNIKWGIRQAFESGSSKLYNRKCYGYYQDKEGNLCIQPEQAKTVQLVFDLYLSGYSLLAIIRELFNRGIPSPTGKDRWTKAAIVIVLENEKYTGSVMVGKTYCGDFPNNKRKVNQGQQNQYLMQDSHTPIISAEQFDLVKAEKTKRSNIEKDEYGTKRKSTHYSMKKTKPIEDIQ